jgi:predicted metal-dependent phosphoesterase TrpH
MRCEYDLHVHSTFSDGTLSPRLLLEKAVSMGLTGISITDHDTFEGIPETINYIDANSVKIDFVPGVELNTEPEEEGNEVHILGYYIDYGNAGFRERLMEIRDQRKNRAIQMVAKLNDLGFKISFENVISFAGSDLIGRPHVAKAMVEAGYAENMNDVFAKYIEYGRPAYVKRYKFSPREALDLIKSSGGIAVLAHPGLIKNQALVGKYLNEGIDGLEVFYPQHTDIQTEHYLKLALENKLLVTGGSDYHGPGSSESRARMGASGIDSVLMKQLKKFNNK